MTVAVFFGGRSCEHDISIITGLQVLNELKIRHSPIPIYIDYNGEWLYSKDFFDIAKFRDKSKLYNKPQIMDKKLLIKTKIKNNLSKNIQQVHFRPNDKNLYNQKGKIIANIDVCVICNHGLMGEDGTLQGLLQLYNIPYSGSNVRASAISMDKINMKDVLKQNGIKMLNYIGINKNEYDSGIDECIAKLETFQYPLIVKPSNLGSSIGITIAKDKQELIKALEIAFEFDNRVIVEQALTDFIECNCAVLGGTMTEKITSEVEQPIGWKEILRFADKYEKSSKLGNINKNMPANLPIEIRQQIQSIAKQVFEILGCSGVARVDFLIKESSIVNNITNQTNYITQFDDNIIEVTISNDDNKEKDATINDPISTNLQRLPHQSTPTYQIYVNELNAIPGSLSNYLFSYNQFNFTTLLDKLIQIAKQEHQQQNSIQFTYDSSVLQNIKGTKK